MLPITNLRRSSALTMLARVSTMGEPGLKHLRQLLCGILTITFFNAITMPVRADEYRLSGGDVLELSVLGIPELNQRVAIELTGTAFFPLIGEVQAGGLSLRELRSELQKKFTQQSFRKQDAAGIERVRLISGSDLLLNVAEYRPLYISGYVARAGEIPFRSGITIRQAIAISGGYATGALDGEKLAEATALKTRYESLNITYAKEKLRVRSIENALGRTEILSNEDKDFNLIQPKILRAMERDTEEALKSEQDNFNSQRLYLIEAIKMLDQMLLTLTNQSENEAEGAKIDAVEAERTNELHQRGLVPISRVTEMRRAALIAASRALQTGVAAENAKRDREELKSRLQRLDSSHRLTLLRELEDAKPKAESTRAELLGLRKKLILAGIDSSFELKRSINITVFRKQGNIVSTIDAGEDDEAFPGDVIEVTMHSQVND